MFEQFKCPKCGTALQSPPNQLVRYETLLEHVVNPNQTPPLRSIWICLNPSCPLHEEVFWGFTGELYKKRGSKLSLGEIAQLLPESSHAVNSPQWKTEKQLQKDKTTAPATPNLRV